MFVYTDKHNEYGCPWQNHALLFSFYRLTLHDTKESIDYKIKMIKNKNAV